MQSVQCLIYSTYSMTPWECNTQLGWIFVLINRLVWQICDPIYTVSSSTLMVKSIQHTCSDTVMYSDAACTKQAHIQNNAKRSTFSRGTWTTQWRTRVTRFEHTNPKLILQQSLWLDLYEKDYKQNLRASKHITVSFTGSDVDKRERKYLWFPPPLPCFKSF